MSGRARWLPLGLAAGSTLLTLLLVEVGLRVASGAPFARPDPGGAVRMVGEAYPGEHHPELGYVPRPGPAKDNVWGTTVTITPDGLRSNGSARAPAGAPVLAVGDSFTFGDEVSDHETWPARLEEALGRPVWNAGVFGYGLDQIVLRAEAWLERGDVRTVVLSFAPDDVLRCEYSYRYAWKPWFEVEAGALVLRGVPVPGSGAAARGEALWRRILRVSFLGDLVMRRLDPGTWLLPDSVREHRQGVSVGRLLMDRVADTSARVGADVLVVMQWHPLARVEAAAPVMARARERGLAVLDLRRALQRATLGETSGAAGLFHHTERAGVRAVGHLSARGNAVVADAIAARLRGMASR